MQIRKVISVLISVIFLAAVVCSAADKIDLKLRLKAGDSHEMKMTQTQNIAQTMNGSEMKMKQTMEMVFGIDCLGADANGIMDMEMAYKSVRMVMEGPMGSMEFDSANPKPATQTDPTRK